jgi:adenylate cyclase
MREKTKVLLVEDEQVTSLLIQRWLKDAGYAVLTSYSGEQAMDLLREKPSIGLIDFMLPGITGFELIKKIQKLDDGKFPIVIMSANNTEDTIVQALECGAVDFIPKPLNKSEVLLRLGIHNKLWLRELELIETSRKLEKEKKLLSKYFSDDLVDNILNETIQPNLGGTSLDASILFFDLRNSTKISNDMDSSSFAEFLSLLLTDIMDLIYGCNGSVNKLMGDGILATFGCPVPTANDAFNCISCGIKILEYLKMFNDFRPEVVKERIQAGIGIASGKVFAGNIGSVRRMEYTVLGEAVNVASRLENLTKIANAPILIDENTVKILANSKIPFIKTEIHNVRGIVETMNIYTLRII